MALLARLGSMVGRGEKRDSSSQSDTGDLRVTLVLAPETAATIDPAHLANLGASIHVFDGGLEKFSVNGPLLRRTDLVILEIEPESAQELAALEQFANSVGARIPVVAAAHDLTITATRRLMRSSIADEIGRASCRERV
jgi:pilus assembly protein CpaE